MTILVRSVRCASPIRPGEPSGAALVHAALQRYVAGVVPIVAVFVVVSSLTFGTQPRNCWWPTDRELARVTAMKYAYEAYPSWRRHHPERACPTSWAELNQYVNNKDLRDPWGTEYRFYCGDHGVVVVSAGEDGRFGTADDVSSLR